MDMKVESRKMAEEYDFKKMVWSRSGTCTVL